MSETMPERVGRRDVAAIVGSRRARLARTTRRIAAGLLALVVALVASGLAYQTIAEARDRRAYPPPGRLVDVGGYRLHLHLLGADKAGPTVILDAGSGSMSAQWGWVQDEVATFARVVAYDRPGTGYSDQPPAPRDARALAEDLHAALAAVGAPGPYVVVGHSMGSLTARAFAARYPAEVAGVVLVDPRHLRLHDDFPALVPVDPAAPPLEVRLLPVAARLGATRLLDMLGDYADQLPPRRAAEIRAAVASTKQQRGLWPDVVLGEGAAALLARTERPSDTPLVVLSAGEPDPLNFPGGERSAFTALHRRMAATLSTRGEHRVLAGADHYSIVTHREHATAIAAAIRERAAPGR